MNRPIVTSSNSIPESNTIEVNTDDLYPGLKALADREGALLLVGHGTRSPAGQHQLLALAQSMQNHYPEIRMQPCFLELAVPNIETGLRQLRDSGIKRLLIVPILLFTAGHAMDDIPTAVAQNADQLGMEVIGQSPPLNLHPQVLALSQLRCSETIRSRFDSDILFNEIRNRFIIDRTDKTERQFEDIALAMIGRGTSQVAARDAMREFVRLRCACYPVAWSSVGFFAGDAVSVTDALEQAGTQQCSNTIIVQPHLLFEGDLSQQLRAIVGQYQTRYPMKVWHVAQPLGGDDRLSQTYLSLAEQTLSRTA
jgi:sirohydrochlorin cobaltochelatase